MHDLLIAITEQVCPSGFAVNEDDPSNLAQRIVHKYWNIIKERI